MKVWNKETRNENGVFYRKSDWGVEIENFQNFKRKDNFTDQEPLKDQEGNIVEQDFIDGTWVINAKGLDSLKDKLKAKINQKTDQLILQGFDHNGVHFDMKAEDQLNINTLFNLLNMGVDLSGQYFRASGEDYFFQNNDDFLALITTGNTIKTQYIQSGASLKSQVDQCISISELEAIIDER